jgi:hypothetical protein
MLVIMQLMRIIGAAKLERIIAECFDDGDDATMVAETLGTVAGVDLTGAQLGRLAAVLANGNYKSALAVYKAS